MDFSENDLIFRHALIMRAAFYFGEILQKKRSVNKPMENNVQNNEKHKIKLSSEATYVAAIILLAFAVAMLSAADFGISMIVAPAYLLSLKTGVLTFGQAEYVIQAGLFVVLCIILRKFRFVYLFSFVTCLIYGAVLDLWRMIPFFNPAITPSGSMDIWLRAIMFVSGVIITSFSIALFFKTYLYPQVYDFFVKAVSSRYGIKISVLKTIVDLSCLTASIVMTFVFFGSMEGIGWGTLVMAVINGAIIGFFSKILDKFFDFQPTFPRFGQLFELIA